MDPRAASERDEMLVLACLPGMNRRRLSELLSFFGSPASALCAVRHGHAPSSSDSALVDSWKEAALKTEPEALAASMEVRGISFVVSGDECYPALLAATREPPVVLFVKGTLPSAAHAVAVVGARKAGGYGVEAARWLAEGLAERGVAVVSGAAWGIDSAAHRGALEAGGTTVAVMGCGVDVAYPRSNGPLLSDIARSGCVLSEYPPGTEPMKHRFPERNRIIAGLAGATVVVEASESSGALLTADIALSEGRDVFAVPGSVFSKLSRGANSLIRCGATPATCPADILETLGIEPDLGGGASEAMIADDPTDAAVLDALAEGISEPGELAAAAGLSTPRLLALLTRLEVEGAVVRGLGGEFHPAARVRRGRQTAR